jgi:hypothetical protein
MFTRPKATMPKRARKLPLNVSADIQFSSICEMEIGTSKREEFTKALGLAALLTSQILHRHSRLALHFVALEIRPWSNFHVES